VKIIRVGSTDYSRSQMRRRVLNYLTYVAFSVPRALFVPCDVVVGMTDPPFEGIVAAFVAMLKRKPFVYNIRDLYPDMAVGGRSLVPDCWRECGRVASMGAAAGNARGGARGGYARANFAKGVKAEHIAVVRDGAEICGAGASLRRTKRWCVRFEVISSLCWCTREPGILRCVGDAG